MYRKDEDTNGSQATPDLTPVEEPRCWLQTDRAGTIIDLSPGAAALIGFSRRGAIGRPFHQFFGQDRDAVLHDMRMASGGAPPMSRERLVRGRGTKGAWLQVRVQPAPEAGEVVWILGPR